jgi:hypothetical protein
MTTTGSGFATNVSSLRGLGLGPKGPPPQVPEVLPEADLGREIGLRLAGRPADGSGVSGGGPPAQVIWVDAGDEVLVHLDSTRVSILDRLLLVSVDLETDQTGRSPLVCTFALGGANDPAGLVAVAEDLPRGNPVLAARWGLLLQNAVWAALLTLAADHALGQNAAPLRLGVSKGSLRFQAGDPPIVLRRETPM